MPRGELGGHVEHDLHPLVAAADPGAMGDAATLDAQHLPGLRAGRDAHLALAVEGRHLELRAESGLRKADGDLAEHVVADPAEETGAAAP